ncbi:general odorant-binding protein 84a [Uranotaenia lowii]|uniref:general odorant-binding protein 84a n=1 Tax=Uranotaenia lowii TaxID=190385 RepID=UPI00247A05E3|nr:general odorant-binding protein 84a [Uranotaenia lowii]
MSIPSARLILLLGYVAILAASGCSMNNNDDADLKESLLADPSEMSNREAKDVSFEDIHAECNKTFIIQMDYLKELNDTGSYPDETDKTPMCFMRCVLQKAGIVTEDDKVNKDQAVHLAWAKNGDAIDDCLQEMTGSSCERSYFLARCIATRQLVEGRSKDNKK